MTLETVDEMRRSGGDVGPAWSSGDGEVPAGIWPARVGLVTLGCGPGPLDTRVVAGSTCKGVSTGYATAGFKLEAAALVER